VADFQYESAVLKKPIELVRSSGEISSGILPRQWRLRMIMTPRVARDRERSSVLQFEAFIQIFYPQQTRCPANQTTDFGHVWLVGAAIA
jgi:hypothetical protein